MHVSRRTVVVAGALSTAFVAGCQTYTERPLDAAATLDALAERDGGDDSVRALAASLRAGDSSGSAFDLTDGVDRAEATVIAQVWNPDLRRLRSALGVAVEVESWAGQWDDPVLSLDLLRATSGIPHPWIVAPSLSFTVPAMGRMDDERAHAAAQTAMARAQVAAAEWVVRCAVHDAFTAWSAAARQVAEIERAQQAFAPLITAMSQQAEAGELAQSELTLFTLEVDMLAVELLQARMEATAADGTLRQILGIAPTAPIEFEMGFAPAGAGSDESPSTPSAHVAAHPAMRVLDEAYQVAERAVALEIRRQWPDLTIGPAYERDTGQTRIGVIGAWALPIFNANRAAIARARAERTHARMVYDTALEERLHQVRAAEARVRGAVDARGLMLTTVAPQVDQHVAAVRQLLEFGEVSPLVLLESLRRAHAARLALLDLEREVDSALTNLARHAGPVDDSTSLPSVVEDSR